ncbi:MAG: OmpA family protein [Myxococcota bacterium]
MLFFGTFLLASLVPGAVGPSTVEAQEGFSLVRLRPPPTYYDGFALDRPTTPGHLGVTAAVLIDYGHGPLVLEDASGEDVGSIVEHALLTHLQASLGVLDILQFSVDMPFALVMSGDSPSVPGFNDEERGAAAGDLRIGGELRVVGEPAFRRRGDAPEVRLSVAAALLVPTGSETDLLGDGGVGFQGGVAGEIDAGVVIPAFNLGIAVRPSETFVNTELGPELTFGVGAIVPVAPIELEFALRGALTLTGDDSFSSVGSPLELLLGLRSRVATYLSIGGGLSVGLTDGLGVPDVRALFQLGVVVPGEGHAPTEEDEDDDSEYYADEDEEDAPRGGEGDREGDGVPDEDDFCPDESETENFFLDDDGCADGVRRTDTHIVVTPSILFERGSAELPDEAEEALGLILELMEDVEFLQIEGYASIDEGDDQEALTLSEERADAVLRWFLENGVSASRATAVGVGGGQPVEGAPPSESRRVEFRVLE